MSYKYETHMHTAEASACATSTGAEMARAHKEAGYTGIFVTDHFFNGNTTVPRELPWQERVARFCLGYEHAKQEGDKIGLQVFFGFEYAYHGAEFLVYNLDKNWLLHHENIDLRSPPAGRLPRCTRAAPSSSRRIPSGSGITSTISSCSPGTLTA